MESLRETLSKAVVDAWHKGEPYGLLLTELYRACGMTRAQAIQAVREHKAHDARHAFQR